MHRGGIAQCHGEGYNVSSGCKSASRSVLLAYVKKKKQRRRASDEAMKLSQKLIAFIAFTSEFHCLHWEKLNRGVSKPRCFPLFLGKVQIVSRTLSGLFLVGALNRPRKRKGTNRENPQTIPEQIGKIPEKSGKDKKGQKRKDESRSGNPPV